MAKTTFTATFGDQTFTRKSDRTYTHAVSCKRNYAAAIAYASTQDKFDAKNHAYYCKKVATNDFYSWENEECKDRARKAAAVTCEEFCQQQIARRVADVDARKARGEYDNFLRPTFHSTLALAQKEAAKDRAAGRLQVTIAEVTSN